MASSVLIYYLSLMEMSYTELISFLRERYGSATDDYFRESSYIKFLNGKIKNITKGNYSRTNEGLYCHHLYEDRYENLSDKKFIKWQRTPFNTQKAKNLIYCNHIEHTILHYLIAKESKKKYGYQGLVVFLIPILKEWYIEKKLPKLDWHKRVFDKSYLSEIDAMILVSRINENLNR